MSTIELHTDTFTLPTCEATYPLAAEQRGLWYVQQLAPNCGAYHLVFSFAVTYTGGDTSNFKELLTDIIADYPILRTSLPATDSGPQQWVWNSVTADIRHHDARDIAHTDLRERMRQDTREPFNLAQPPCWRIHCYRTDEQKYVIAVVVHHVLLDFWSLGLLLQDVAVHLGLVDTASTTVNGEAFGAYAVRQAEQLKDPVQVATWLKYWHAQLQDAPPVHSIPLDHSRPALQTYEGRSLPFSLSPEVSEGVKRLAQNAGATPFMVLLSAYYVLLYHFSGETDLVVATPVAGRTERSQRNLLGQFVNTLALRCQLDPDTSFTQLLDSVKQLVIDGIRHQTCPFSWLVENIAPQRDPSVPPLVQIGFNWERLPLLAEFADFFLAEPSDIERKGPGFTLRPYPIPQQEGQLDLLLEMGGERDGALLGVLKFHEHLFKKESAQEMVKAFTRIVGEIVSTPESKIVDISLIEPDRLTTWLKHGRGTSMRLPDTCVLKLIRHQAASTPDAIAICDGDTEYSYRALIEGAERLGAYLISLGVQPEDHVGLMLGRQCELVVAILGIWFAGAAYVPLDPSFPSDRLKMIAKDAALSALVSTSSFRKFWPSTPIPAVCLNSPLPFVPAPSNLSIGHTAYLIYTSGSTGKPKGVRVGHRSVLNFLRSMQTLLPFRAQQRLLAVTTPAFDISVLELLLPLLCGGTVVVCDRDTSIDGVKLARRLQNDDIDLLQATPATWKMLVDAGWEGTQNLVALCGGEALAPSLADALLKRVGELWNVYGPTETTVWSTATRIQPHEPIHLGQPLANTQLYVLDAQQRPVPPGVLGELWIGGKGLAIDYWQRPELTQQQFTRVRTLPEAGRLYRTGDRVRWSADGRLEHHGRLDFQVKLRGFRIELGEIETVLRRQPGIQDAVAMVREDRKGDQRLVAYLVGQPSLPAVLSAALREVLPAYMVPSAFIFLESFPQTPNRKVNRKALPAPTETGKEDLVAPRDATEIQLANLFTQLLGLAEVSIYDNFFALGGHSLLAVQLVAGINQLFGIELPVSTLIQHGSVAELAAMLRNGASFDPSMLITLRAGHDSQPLWLFHPIGGNIFCYLELTRHLDAKRPVLAFQAPGLDQDDGADVTIEAMAQRYLHELRKHQPTGPYLLGGWCFGGIIAFEVARQLRDAGEAVDGLTMIDTRAPIAENVPSDADDATLLSWFARDLASPFGKSLQIEPDVLRALPVEDMFNHVLSAAKAIEVLPEDADTSQLHRYFEVYLANGIALQMYFPPQENFPVLLLKAQDEKEDYGPSLGWSALVPTSLQQIDLPGDHSSIMYAPQASAVATAIDGHYAIKPLSGCAL